MKKLSIIIPHYNTPDLLLKLLSTIPDVPSIQVIVVDDNSNVNYIDKIKRNITNSNVELYFNTSGLKGAGVCRNIGLNNAEGKWILFADADDFFLEDAFSIIKRYLNTNFDVIYFVPTSINLKDGSRSTRHLNYQKRLVNYLKNPNKFTENILRYRFSAPWSKLIRKDFIIKNNILFDEVIASNDVMFSAKVGANLKKFHVSEEKIYCVTRSEGSLTRTMNKSIFLTRFDVFLNYNKYLKSKLTETEYQNLGIVGSKYIKMSLNFDILTTISVYNKLKRNKIKIIQYKKLNPLRLLKSLLKVTISKFKKRTIY